MDKEIGPVSDRMADQFIFPGTNMRVQQPRGFGGAEFKIREFNNEVVLAEANSPSSVCSRGKFKNFGRHGDFSPKDNPNLNFFESRIPDI